MDTVSNPTATLHHPPGAAVEKSALVNRSSGAAMKKSALVGRIGVTGDNVCSQIVFFGDLEAIVSPSFTSPAVSFPITTPISDGDQKKTTNFDQSTLLGDVGNGTQQECSESNIGRVNAAKKPAGNKPSSNVAQVTSVMGADSWSALSESSRASPKPFSPDMHKSYSDGSIYHPAQLPSTDDAPNNSVKHDNFANDSSSRDNLLQNGGQRGRGGLGSQLHPGNDHRPQRNSFRRGGSRFHANVHNGYGGRHGNQDRGNHDWNPSRRFLGRDAHIQPQGGPPLAPLMRGPPPPPLPFVPTLQMHPLGIPVVYPPDARPLFYAQVPPNSFAPFSPRLPMLLPPLQLRANLVNQVDYYFSDKNLIKDTFLRQKMDDQGWVPIQLIASFNKVKQLTNNVQFVRDAIRSSSMVEVEGEKVRRRNDWKKWLIPASLKHSTLLSPRSREDIISVNIENTSLDDKKVHRLSPSSSGEWTSYPMQQRDEKKTHVPVQVEGGVEG